MSHLWVFLPVIGALLAHAPVLRFDLFPALARPIDGGATFRGRRLFGENKTWRGALTMFSGVAGLAFALSLVPGFWSRLPAAIREAGALDYGVLLGLGTVLVELPNSFIKRQLDIPPGRQQRSPLGLALMMLDQGDFVLGAWITLAPIWIMSAWQAATAFVAVTGVHLVANVVGYAIGARTTAI